MQTLKKLLGLAPQADAQGGFTPSPIALKLTTRKTSDYDDTDFSRDAQVESKKILMVCTEERYMTMRNGKKFSTGNHPLEMLVPMLHLEKAGFEFDVYTPNGRPVAVEMWAMPESDQRVKAIYEKYKPNFEKPFSLKELSPQALDAADYLATFLPGGHGAMLGLPENEDLKRLIQWGHDKDRYMLAICHGPAALLAAQLKSPKESFPYRGYKMAVFPDSLDKKTPALGYIPGHMPWYFGEKLQELGVQIINTKANGSCFQDRKLITGDSPNAANEFGKMAARALLAELDVTKNS